MRHLLRGLLFSMVVLAVIPGQAEIYKYRDAQGNISFTDDWAQVPPDQRPQAEFLQAVGDNEAERPASPEVKPSDPPQVETQVDPDREPADMAVSEEAIASLNARKNELDSEFAGLMTEKYGLLQEKEKLAGLAGRDVEAREAYEEKVLDLNRRIADYKMRRDAFQTEAEQVTKALTPIAPDEDDRVGDRE